MIAFLTPEAMSNAVRARFARFAPGETLISDWLTTEVAHPRPPSARRRTCAGKPGRDGLRRAQVAHLSQGWAFGLWDWLEKKFQNTEEDSVNDLITQWMQLHMEEEESFDAYRARVNRIHTLLELAQEKPSARQYSYTLTDKLAPHFKQAILALKASGKLKEADMVDWEAVTAFINAHERSEHRLAQRDISSEGSQANTMAMAARGYVSGNTGSSGGRRPRSLADMQCFNCSEYGHLASQCSLPHKASGSAAQAGQEAPESAYKRGSHGGAGGAGAAISRGRHHRSVQAEQAASESAVQESRRGVPRGDSVSAATTWSLTSSDDDNWPECSYSVKTFAGGGRGGRLKETARRGGLRA